MTLALPPTTACGGGSSSDDDGPDAGAGADAESAPDAFVDLTVDAFEPGHLIEIDIDMAGADWDTLRNQARSAIDIFGPPCLQEPFADPFTYFPATVTIDGVVLEQSAVRKKGFLGSLSATKPSLIVKLDEYVADRSWSGLERLTLNNGNQDPSLVHTCLAYQVFADAGTPAPRCNFAHVTVNGTDLGIYANVEAIKKPFLRRHFESDDGDLYEGTLADFRTGWTVNFEKKTNESTPTGPEIDALLEVLENAADGELLDQLEPLLDVDGFIREWASEVLIGHWDGYASDTNNFFVYVDPADGRMRILPWGADATFQDPNGAVVAATGILSRRLYLLPETRDRYLAELQRQLDEVWDESALLGEIDRMETLITPVADPDGTLGLAASIGTVRTFVSDRQAAIETALAGGPPAWTTPLRDPICFADIGQVDIDFATTWNGGFTGTATVNVATYRGAPISFTQTNAVAGLDTSSGAPIVVPLGTMADGATVFFFLTMAPALVAPGTQPVDGIAVNGFVIHQPAGQTGAAIAYLDGTLVLNQAAMTPGAPVTGSLTARLLWWF
ncbi:MAG TPA: CotH kinase family protein [Kofleriaceae bacterium]|nr:CotH kinase family protein [Kofleriaceae bacterium]